MAKKDQSAADALARVPLLSGLDDRARRRLVKTMKERTYAPGHDVVVEGGSGLGFFVITEGGAAVSIGGEPVRQLGPGDYFGEMALIHGDKRSATVTATTELTCRTMSSWAFKTFVRSEPSVAWVMLEGLVRRLMEASTR